MNIDMSNKQCFVILVLCRVAVLFSELIYNQIPRHFIQNSVHITTDSKCDILTIYKNLISS